MSMQEVDFETAARREADRRRERNRNQAEQSYDVAAEYWDVARNDRLRGAEWFTSRISPDGAAFQELDIVRQRSAQMIRDDPIASGAMISFIDNVVGTGLVGQAKVGDLDAEDDKASQDAVYDIETLAYRQFKTIGIGNLSFNQVQQMMAWQWGEAGSAVCVRVDKPDRTRRRPLPLRLQVIDARRMETPPSARGDKNIRMGVRRDEDGDPLEYYFRDYAPGNELTQTDASYTTVPAERVCHLHSVMHPDQTQGAPWMTPVLSKLKDLAKFSEAELMGAIVRACFSVFITSDQPYEQAKADEISPIVDQDGKPIRKMSPGMIAYNPWNRKIEFAEPRNPGATFGEYMVPNLRIIAAGLGYVYEMLARDYSDTTYAGGRLGRMDGLRFFQNRQQIMREAFLDPAWQWTVQECVQFGGARIDKRDYRLRSWWYDGVDWIAPGNDWVDPEKEVNASETAMNIGLTSAQIECGKLGRDWQANFRQLAREARLRKKLGLPELAPKLKVPPPGNNGNQQEQKPPKQVADELERNLERMKDLGKSLAKQQELSL